ncbi:hypothetical protein CMT19_16745 [Elizabethkingia anophelis]|nr:hypothetical protein [Elizabethkingia anophelis]
MELNFENNKIFIFLVIHHTLYFQIHFLKLQVLVILKKCHYAQLNNLSVYIKKIYILVNTKTFF